MALLVNEAIVKSIQEVCQKYSLNCSNISNSNGVLQWKSTIAPFGGKVRFQVPFHHFESALEHGMQHVSVLVAFADLIAKDENKGMVENMLRAWRMGAPYYYTTMSNNHSVRMFLPSSRPSVCMSLISTLDISYTRDDATGDYIWTIPDSETLYREFVDTEQAPDSEQMERQISEYTGLVVRQSSGIPVMETTQSAREWSIPEPINSDPQ
jgi:hypothetical protein